MMTQTNRTQLFCQLDGTDKIGKETDLDKQGHTDGERKFRVSRKETTNFDKQGHSDGERKFRVSQTKHEQIFFNFKQMQKKETYLDLC